jgi:hypothetical protein
VADFSPADAPASARPLLHECKEQPMLEIIIVIVLFVIALWIFLKILAELLKV